MRKIKARDLAALSTDEIWKIEEGKFELVFDDGSLVTNARRTIYSWYYWEFIRRDFGGPLLKSHHIGDASLTPRTHLDLSSFVLWDTYYATEEKHDLVEMSKIIYEVTRDIFNNFSYRIGHCVTSVSILDHIAIIDDPVISDINKNVTGSENSILSAYGSIKKELKDERFAGNNVKRVLDSKLASVDQVLQTLGPRGHVTDIDSSIFEEPILTNYTEGMKLLKDSMAESRSGSKALMMTKEPLAETEFFNRRMQLGCSVIRNIHRGDCGSDQYLHYTVSVEDLVDLNGKWHVTDKNELKLIGPSSTELIGQTIKMRSPTTCHHTDPYGICSTCMGILSHSIPPNTNVGHISATELCAPVSQAVLSTKHLDKTAVLERLYLTDEHRRILRVSEDTGDVYFREDYPLAGLKINISKDTCRHVGDIQAVDDVSNLLVTQVSSLAGLILEIPQKDLIVEEVVPTMLGTTQASLSKEMLSYMRESSWDLDENSDFRIDMGKWNAKKPILTFPRKHLSMMEFMKKIAGIIESGKNNEEGRKGASKRKDAKVGYKVLSDFDSPSAALEYLHREVSAKVRVNIAHLEVIVLSTMVRNSEAGDHRLPKPHNNADFGKYRENLSKRSLSAQLAFQYHHATLTSPSSFVRRARPDHPMDAILRG